MFKCRGKPKFCAVRNCRRTIIKLNKIIERISNYDNPDKSNILQESIINQLPHTQKIKQDKLNIIEKKEQLNEMEMSEEIVEGTEKCIDYNLDKKSLLQ